MWIGSWVLFCIAIPLVIVLPKKIKSDNFSRINREKSKITIAILEKLIIS